MSQRYALIVVEGPHDRAFVGRVLKAMGFSSFNGDEKRLDPFWESWKPKYPAEKNLYAPLDMPYIWENKDWSVAVKAAGGSKIFSTVPTQLDNKKEWRAELMKNKGAMAIVADADQDRVGTTFKKLEQAYNMVLGGFPNDAGSVISLPFRLGAFVLPDCSNEGTVESVLLTLGQTNHGRLLVHANNFVNGCEPELKAHFGPFDHLKAKVAAAASILQPGSTNTITIERDKWITMDQLNHTVLAPFVAFLKNLLEMPVSVTEASIPTTAHPSTR